MVKYLQPFTHYKINENEDGCEVILYVDENLTEFSSELGTSLKIEETNMKVVAKRFVKRMFPTLKVKTVKIMAGGVLLSTLGLGTLPVTQASAAEPSIKKTQTNSTSYTVSSGDTLYSIALKNGTTVDAIKKANNLSSNLLKIGQILIIPIDPALTPIQPNGQTYQVVTGDTLYSIAQQNGTTVDAIKAANNLTSNLLSIGQTLKIPTGQAAPTQSNGGTHQVVSGDTLYNIAKRNGTTVDAIKAANNLSSDVLSIGQTLKIPDGQATPTQTNGTSHKVNYGDTLYSIAQRNGTTVDAIKAANNLSSDVLSIGQTLTIPAGQATPPQTNGTSHKVTSGDTLYGIAQRNGTTVDAIKAANNLSSDVLSIGQTLTIPNGVSVTPAETPLTAKQETVENQEEVEWLAKMIHSEAKGESFEGQVAVGAVIMNRVKSPLFPNSIKEVLFEKSYGYYQFTPAETGIINTAKPTEQNREAAKRALNGEDPTNGALFFYNPDKTSSTYLRSRTVSTTIGNHVFAF